MGGVVSASFVDSVRSDAAWEILVAGSTSWDDVTTPAGRARGVLGGSAVYFALAAHWFAPVRLTSAVGRDHAADLHAALVGRDIEASAVEISRHPTYRWTAVHDIVLGTTLTERSDLGAMKAYSGRLSPAGQQAPVAFLGSMDPRLQLEIREQLARPRLLAVDTMNKYIREDRQGVWSAFQGADVVFMNESEASHLAGIADPEEAARRIFTRLRPRAFVLKLGAAGAAVLCDGAHLAQPAVAIPAVVDPTGAGDAFAGGFLGELAGRQSADADPDLLAGALRSAVVMASFAVEAFGVEGLRTATRERVAVRMGAAAPQRQPAVHSS